MTGPPADAVWTQCSRCGVRGPTVHLEPVHPGVHLVHRRHRVGPRRGFLCDTCAGRKAETPPDERGSR